jgi:hypothetical protein
MPAIIAPWLWGFGCGGRGRIKWTTKATWQDFSCMKTSVTVNIPHTMKIRYILRMNGSTLNILGIHKQLYCTGWLFLTVNWFSGNYPKGYPMPTDHSTSKWTEMRGPRGLDCCEGNCAGQPSCGRPPAERDFVIGDHGLAGQSVVTVTLPTVRNLEAISSSCCVRPHNFDESWGRPGGGK